MSSVAERSGFEGGGGGGVAEGGVERGFAGGVLEGGGFEFPARDGLGSWRA